MVKMKQHGWFIVLAAAMLFWGGSWTSGKILSDITSSQVIIFWRFFITFLSFIPVVLFLKEPLKITRKAFIQLLFGTLFLGAYNLFFFEGLKAGLAGSGGVIVTTLNPIFTFLLLILFFRQKGSTQQILGLILGLIGGLLLMKVWNIGSGKLLDGGNLFFLFAAISWAFLSITSQKSKEQMSPLVFSFYLYGFSTFVDFFIALPHGVFDVADFPPVFWFNIIYLSLAATTFGTTAYFFAASHLGASKASSFTFLVPFSAVFFSWLILDEVIKLPTIIGGLLALIAVYIINMKIGSKRNKPKIS